MSITAWVLVVLFELVGAYILFFSSFLYLGGEDAFRDTITNKKLVFVLSRIGVNLLVSVILFLIYLLASLVLYKITTPEIRISNTWNCHKILILVLVLLSIVLPFRILAM